jgi:hypothetical protein
MPSMRTFRRTPQYVVSLVQKLIVDLATLHVKVFFGCVERGSDDTHHANTRGSLICSRPAPAYRLPAYYVSTWGSSFCNSQSRICDFFWPNHLEIVNLMVAVSTFPTGRGNSRGVSINFLATWDSVYATVVWLWFGRLEMLTRPPYPAPDLSRPHTFARRISYVKEW